MLDAELDLLVISAQAGDVTAFRKIVAHYHQGLVRYALNVCGDPEIAQDAVQDAWLQMFRQLRRLEDPRKFRGFIYQLVHWRSLDQGRKKKRRADVEESLDDLFTQASPVAAIDKAETVAVLLKRLPALERHMLHLFYLEELPIKEIAGILEIPAGTVKSRLNRARNLLKQRYKADE